jgi:hypothetical protein
LIASHGLAAGAARVVDYDIGLVYFVAKHDCGKLLLDVGRGAGGGPSFLSPASASLLLASFRNSSSIALFPLFTR